MKKYTLIFLLGGLFMQPLFAQPFTTDNRISDILTQPQFQGFAERLLPWDDQRNDPDLRLSQIGRLMPYHSHISPQTVTNTLNKMVTRAEQGERIFYDIYTEAEKRQDPSKRQTGVFVFKGKPNAPFAMIAAGGGFAYVGSLHEGFPIAQSVSEQGYNAFVVKYRAGMGGQIATEDMAQAIEFVRKNAKTLQIDPDGYSVWGGSAGARMAANIGSYGTQAFGTAQNSKPNCVVMLYTGHSDINRHGEPATFIAVGEQDGIASPHVMKRRIEQLKAMNVPIEFHLYKNLEHGFALGSGTTAEGWEKRALEFWQRQR